MKFRGVSALCKWEASMDTCKSLRKTGISPSGEIPSCPHNALLEILSKNHARVVPDGFLRDLLVPMPALSLNYARINIFYEY